MEISRQRFAEWELTDQDQAYLDKIETPTKVHEGVFTPDEIEMIRKQLSLVTGVRTTSDVGDNGVRTNRINRIVQGFNLVRLPIFELIKSRIPLLQDPNIGISYALFSRVFDGYKIHTDSGRKSAKSHYRNILIPLEIVANDEEKYARHKDDNCLFIFNQKSRLSYSCCYGSAKEVLDTIEKNNQDVYQNGLYVPLVTKELYADFVLGYTGVDNSMDERVINLCSHLPRDDFHGLSFKESCKWTPGNVVEFDSRYAHTSTNFKDLGCESKELFLIFTYLKDFTGE